MELWRLLTTWDFPMLSCHLHQNRNRVRLITTAALVRHQHFAAQTLGLCTLQQLQPQLSLRTLNLRLISVSISIGSTLMGRRKTLQYKSDVLLPGRDATCGVTRGIGSSMVLTYKTRELAQQQSYLCLLDLFIYFTSNVSCQSFQTTHTAT